MPISKIEDAIKDIKKGKMVILVDDQDRENEGDLIISAEFATPEAINFMATHGRGLICLSVDNNKAKKLDLSPVKSPSDDNLDSTAFTQILCCRWQQIFCICNFFFQRINI